MRIFLLCKVLLKKLNSVYSNILTINIFNILTKILINIHIFQKRQDPTL